MMYTILYIDDEEEHIEDFAEENRNAFLIETVELLDDIELMKKLVIESIAKNGVDCIILDFFLKQKRPKLNYTGGSLAMEILRRFEAFPVFLLTAKEEDAFNIEIDPLHIISKEKYNAEGGREYYMKRIDHFILQYKNKVDEAEKRLRELSIQTDLIASEEVEEVELNNFLEKTVIGHSDLPIRKFPRSETSKLDELIRLAEKILDEL